MPKQDQVDKTPEPAGPPELPIDVEEESPSEEAPPTDETNAADEQAVDDIAAQGAEPIEEPAKPKASLVRRIRNGWSAWWHNKTKRRASIAVLAIALLVAGVTPVSRYFMLNTLSVRSRASLTVLDDSTQQPLKNVIVTLGNQTATTDITGSVQFYHVRLGEAQLSVQKRAFATETHVVTIGWGSNPLEPLGLKPVGSQYRFVVTDYLSGEPLAGVEASSGEASAVSNESGEITLTIDLAGEGQTAEVTVAHEGYRTEIITLDLESAEEIKLQLVTERSHVFISRRSGRYDVYRIDADGRNEQRILAGSGVERDDLVLAAHPSKSFAALVSTRENVRKDGFLLSTLTLIDVNGGIPSKIAQSERVQIIDWIGDRLVYVQIAAGASASDPERHRLMSYNLSDGHTKQLAAANYFNDVLAVDGNIYYAPSAAYSSGEPAFYRIAADGNGKQTVLDQEVWNTFRTGYDKLILTAGQEWYEYQISANRITNLAGEPSGLASRVYVNGPENKRSLWVDQRDGQGVLLAYDIAANSDEIIHQQSGLSNPLFWLSESAIVFRVATSDETADYVMSLDGGEPKKLKDVTNTSGIERWYYY